MIWQPPFRPDMVSAFIYLLCIAIVLFLDQVWSMGEEGKIEPPGGALFGGPRGAKPDQGGQADACFCNVNAGPNNPVGLNLLGEMG